MMIHENAGQDGFQRLWRFCDGWSEDLGGDKGNRKMS